MHGIRPGAWLLIGLLGTASLGDAVGDAVADAVANTVTEAVAQLPEALRACVAQKEDSQRLSCYDREIARLDQRAEPAVSPPAAAAVADEKFGLPYVISREEEERSKPQQLRGTIISLASRPHGERVLTLDNNQVWVEKSADPLRMRFKIGDEVVIKRAALGSFLLFHAGRSVRVSRVQ